MLFCLAYLCSILTSFFSFSLIPYFSHLPLLSHFCSCPLCHQSFSSVPSHTVFFHFLLFSMLHWEVSENPSPSQEWPLGLCWLWLSCQQCSEVLIETSGVVKPSFSRWSAVPVQLSWGGWRFLFDWLFVFLRRQCKRILPATVALELIGSRILSLLVTTFVLWCSCTYSETGAGFLEPSGTSSLSWCLATDPKVDLDGMEEVNHLGCSLCPVKPWIFLLQ